MAFVGKVEEDEKEDVEKLDFPAGKALHPCVVRSGGADGLRYTAHDGHVGYCFSCASFQGRRVSHQCRGCDPPGGPKEDSSCWCHTHSVRVVPQCHARCLMRCQHLPHLFDRRISVFTQAVAYVEKFSGGVGEVTRTQDAVVDIRQCVLQRCSPCGWRDHVT